MVDLDLNRPFYKIEFFEPESSQPKYIFSPNIFLDTERPTDDASVPADRYISYISVNSKLEGAVNTAELEIRHNIGAELGIDLEYKVKIYLGFYDHDKTLGPDFSLVYKGFINQIKTGFEKSTIFCKSRLTKITHKISEITFSRMMGLNEIINQIAIDIGGMELAQNGIFDPGISKQPGFGITKTQPLIDHIKKLARYGAMYVFMGVFDKFHAIPWNPSNLTDAPEENSGWIPGRDKTESGNSDFYKHKVLFDERLIDVQFEMFENKYGGIEVVCLKPFSDDSVHTIDPVKIEYRPPNGNGSDKPLNRYKLSHVTREDAEKVAENLFNLEANPIIGEIKSLGAPQIRIGDGVKFEGEIFERMPFENISLNDGSSEKQITEITFHVSEVQHKYDTVEGLVTKVKLKISHEPAGAAAEGEEGEVEEEEEVILEMEVVEEEEAVEGLEEETPVTIIVKTFRPDNEPIPNQDYILITPSGEEIEGTTGDDGTFKHEQMPRGTYELKFKEVLEPGEEEEE